MSVTEKENAELNWSAANQEYLLAGLVRLRLLLQRRVLWLRKVWKREFSPELQNFQGLVITDDEADWLLKAKTSAAEFSFYEQDEEASRLSQQLADRDLRISDAAQAVFASEGPPALEIVARIFHLTPFDRDVLLLCLAPEVDLSFERIYAYIQDDATRKYATANLAMQILGGYHHGHAPATWQSNWERFSPDAPLRRFRLVHTEVMTAGNSGNEPLRLDSRIGSYLLGVNFIDERGAAFLRKVDDVGPLSPDQEEIVQRLERRLRAWTDRDRVPIINLVGREIGSSKAIARQLCTRLGLALYSVDLSRLPSPAERHALYRLMERESMLLPCAYYLDYNEIDGLNRAEVAQALELVSGVRAFFLAASREPLSGERPFIRVRLPETNPQIQFEIWKARLGAQVDSNGALDSFLGRMVQQFQFSPQQIHAVVRAASEAAAVRDPEASVLSEGDLWTAARGHAVRSIEGLAEKIEVRRSLEELVLPPESLQQIREIASQVEQRNRVYEQWGFSTKLSRGRGISALFAGPSGTGKTMAAEVLARHLELDLYRIDLAGVISKYIGETEKNLKRVFDAAEESGAVLFFDEADALFGKRSEVRDSHDRYANIEINYLLQRMEDYRGLAILATNRKSLLDQAFLRRLRFLVDFPFPSAADRIRIWRGIFPPQARVEALDYEFLGRLEIAGGNISNIALNAAFLAASEGIAIEMRHVLIAARREYAKVDKLVLESEFGRYYAAVRQ